jgi:hypothetical protein
VKKFNLPAFRQISLVEVGSFLVWLQKATDGTVTLRQMEMASPIRTSKLGLMLKLCEQFDFLERREIHVSIMTGGKHFANVKFAEKMAIIRRLFLDYEQVQNIIDLLAKSQTGRLKKRHVEEIFGMGPGSLVTQGDVMGFIEWANACELFSYDKKREELILKGSGLPISSGPSVSVAS